MILFTSAIVFSGLILVVILFQVALAAGVPWGEYAMGGKFPGKYPITMRVACLFQIAILVLMGLIVLSKSGLLLSVWYPFAEIAIWFIVAYCVLGTVLNLMTSSVWERRIWAPVTLLMLITSLVVALL